MTDTDRLEARLAAIEARLDRVTDALERFARRAESLEPALTLAAQVEPAVAMAADTFDEWAAAAQRRGVDLDGHGRQAWALAQRLTDPEVAARLERLIELLPKLLPVAELAATFEPTTAMVADMFDEQLRRLETRGVDVEQRLHQVLGLVERLTDPSFHTHLTELVDAAPGLMAATRTGELFGRAVDEVVAVGPAPLGALGLLRALSDPDVQRAAGFAVAVAVRVGRTLPAPTTPTKTT
jgi:uncharacterized protein YjgD (DUF1641 family)